LNTYVIGTGFSPALGEDESSDMYLETDLRPGPAHYEGAVREFEHLLSSRLPLFRSSAYRLLGNTADAEDAVQDAMLAAYKHLDQFRGHSQMSTWLTSIVRNCARMQLRRRPQHMHISLDERLGEAEEYQLAETLADNRPGPEDLCRRSELLEAVTSFAAELSPALRNTFQLRDIDDLSIRETARILGKQSGTVKAQLARARKKIKHSFRRALRQQLRKRHSRVSSKSVSPR
jgi:RNA polymerase sigma-70 factor (ECF subfamily)